MAHRRRQYISEYEYGYQGDPAYRQRLPRNPRLRRLDRLLFFFVVPVPVVGLILLLVGVAVPPLLLGLYAALTQTAAGLLFITLTALGVGGFGKVGFFFTHTRGKRWMTTEEAKANTYLFGVIMLTIGVLAGLLTFKML